MKHWLFSDLGIVCPEEINNNIVIIIVSGFSHASMVTMSIIGKKVYFVLRFYRIVGGQRIYQSQSHSQACLATGVRL